MDRIIIIVIVLWGITKFGGAPTEPPCTTGIKNKTRQEIKKKNNEKITKDKNSGYYECVFIFTVIWAMGTRHQ